jgi:hypothetical protein
MLDVRSEKSFISPFGLLRLWTAALRKFSCFSLSPTLATGDGNQLFWGGGVA